jgi:hypothetical protein
MPHSGPVSEPIWNANTPDCKDPDCFALRHWGPIPHYHGYGPYKPYVYSRNLDPDAGLLPPVLRDPIPDAELHEYAGQYVLANAYERSAEPVTYPALTPGISDKCADCGSDKHPGHACDNRKTIADSAWQDPRPCTHCRTSVPYDNADGIRIVTSDPPHRHAYRREGKRWVEV